MASFPRDWCWVADDGRAYLSRTQTLSIGANPSVSAMIGASAFTVWPTDADGAQTNAALQAVLDPHRLYVDLAALKSGLLAKIDAQA